VLATDDRTANEEGVTLHVTQELLEGVDTGLMPLEGLVEMILEHLERLCPHCRSELARFREQQHLVEEAGPEAFTETFRRLEVVLREHDSQWQARLQRAEALVAEVLAMPEGRRVQRVEAEIARFTEPVVARRLIDAARQATPARAAKARSLAHCAAVICERLAHKVPDRAAMMAEALGLMGNGARLLGDLEVAAVNLRQAQATLQDEGVTDAMVFGHFEGYCACLARDEGRLGEAARLEARASLVFSALAEVELAAESAIRLGEIHYQAEDYRSGIEACERALRHLDRERDPRLVLWARHTETLCLLEMGEEAVARAHFAEDQPLYAVQAVGDNAWRLQHDWLAGRLLAAEDPRQADELLQQAGLDFLAQDEILDSVLVNLDLAEVWQQDGRKQDLEGMAAELEPLLDRGSLRLAAESAATLRQTLTAIRTGVVTPDQLRDTAAMLRRQRRPAARLAS
jgi:tetratricopeptide (TPR) repeat protein